MDGIDYSSKDYRKSSWNKEYTTTRNLPSSRTFNPSTSLKHFLLDYPDINKGIALDIGCGNGRNSFYLAVNGFNKVIGYDISESAINIANEELGRRNLGNKIVFLQGDITDIYDSLAKNKYDLIIDMMTLHTMPKESRLSLFELIKMTLQPEGHFLLFTISSQSDYVRDFVKSNPGPESDSYYYQSDESYIFEKTFSISELQETLKPLTLVSCDAFQLNTDAYGETVQREYLKAIFKNSRI